VPNYKSDNLYVNTIYTSGPHETEATASMARSETRWIWDIKSYFLQNK